MAMTILTKALITELLVVFDELLPSTDESLMVYWFSATRADGYSVVFIVNGLDDSVAIIVRRGSNLAVAHISVHRCASVRILDPQRRILEVISDYGSGWLRRCVIAIDAETIIECSDVHDPTPRVGDGVDPL
jgi:hypothetical protein